MRGLCWFVAFIMLFAGTVYAEASSEGCREILVELGGDSNVVSKKTPFSFLQSLKKRYGVVSVKRTIKSKKLSDKLTQAKASQVNDANLKSLANTYLVTFESGQSIEDAVNTLQRDPYVLHAETNCYSYDLDAFFPNDPKFIDAVNQGLIHSWAFHSSQDIDINAPEAWDVEKGDSNVIVAVIDTGVNVFEEDLFDNVWVNQGETPYNGIDDDGNGYVDDIYGWDFYSDSPEIFDEVEHGTKVAATIAALGNNGIGVVGVAFQCKVMAVKISDPEFNGTTQKLMNAFLYAVDHGAKVINCSWSTPMRSYFMDQAIQYAASNGVTVIASVGNRIRATTLYPSAYTDVIAVGGIDSDGHRLRYSNPVSWVDIYAPGDFVMTIEDSEGIGYTQYGTFSGTSASAALVSGVAALLYSHFPTITSDEVRSRIRQSGRKIITSARDFEDDPDLLSPGVVDAYAALTNAVAVPTTSTVGQILLIILFIFSAPLVWKRI